MDVGDKWVRNVIPTLTIVILIALASLQTIPGQEDVNAGDISVQQPCDNLTQHLENVGIIISGKYVQDGKERILDWGVPVGLVVIKNETMYKGYYVNCVSGEVHTWDEELPAYMLSDPLLSKIDQPIRFQAKFAPSDYKFWILVASSVPIDISETLESLGMEMDRSTDEDDRWFIGYATYDSILKIAELDFVNRITLMMLATGGGDSTTEPGPTPSQEESPASTPQITLIANSIDYPLAEDFIAFIQNKSMEVVHVNASDFDQHNSDEFIVILGGPDAPEGVGEVVQGGF